MKKSYKGRICKVFYCDTMKGNICCVDCTQRSRCDNPCLNHPDRCRLVKSPKAKTRRFTDAQAFNLWQDGKTDAEIGAIVGVSRQRIQVWRDILELPSNAGHHIDTKKYRLSQLKDGTSVVLCEENDKM